MLQHHPQTPPGELGTWLGERAAVDVRHVPDGLAGVDPVAYSLIVSLGSEQSAADDSLPWLASELDLLGEATARGIPVFGVCFGAQVLARVLGGSVTRSPVPEVGWHRLEPVDPAALPAVEWFQWHFDTFELPAGARVLARSPGGIQAFRHGAAAGVQFHPEINPEIVALWVRKHAAEMPELGLDGEAMLTETRTRARVARAASRRLFDTLVAPLLNSRR